MSDNTFLIRNSAVSHVVFVVCFCFSGHDTSSMANCDTYTTTILIELMVVLEVVLVGLESSIRVNGRFGTIITKLVVVVEVLYYHQ